jgi:predicted DNA-binding protein (UPF0251 family)
MPKKQGVKKCRTKMEQDLKEKGLEQEDKWETARTQYLMKIGLEGAKELVLEEDLEVLEEDKMPRPCKRRRVRGRPNSSYFKPAGIRKIELEESILNIDEFEAVRLKDYLNLDQNECAEKMNVSQPTFHRLVFSARKKIADAIVNCKAIKIEGGNYIFQN